MIPIRVVTRCAGWLLVLACWLAASGCAAPLAEVRPLPTQRTTPMQAWLQGPWEMIDASGEVHGTLRMDGRRVMAWAGGTMLLGDWRVEPGPLASTTEITFLFDEVLERGVRVRTDTPRTQRFSVIVLDEEEALALQSDGLWMRWRRQSGEAP